MTKTQDEILALRKFKNDPLAVYTKKECEIINKEKDRIMTEKIPAGNSCCCPYKITAYGTCSVVRKEITNNIKLCGIKENAN